MIIILYISAFVAGHRLFEIIDRDSKIRSPDVYNLNRKPDKRSDATFKQIEFKYPTRPNMKILQNISLDVPEGKTVALGEFFTIFFLGFSIG